MFLEGLWDALDGQLESVGGLVNVEFEPVAAFAPLGLVLEDPEPLDVRVFLVAHAPNHSVGVHGVDNVGVLLGSLSSFPGLQEEGILKKEKREVNNVYTFQLIKEPKVSKKNESL